MQSPKYWAAIVERQWDRVCASQREFADLADRIIREGLPVPQVEGLDARLHYPFCMTQDVVLMLMASRQVLRYDEHYRNLGPTPLPFALTDPAFAPLANVVAVRDRIEHWDEYAVGKGRFSAQREEGPTVGWSDPMDLRSDLSLDLAGFHLDLRNVVKSTVLLAEQLDVYWETVHFSPPTPPNPTQP